MTLGERGGSVVECRTPEREVRGSKPTAAVLCLRAKSNLVPDAFVLEKGKTMDFQKLL